MGPLLATIFQLSSQTEITQKIRSGCEGEAYLAFSQRLSDGRKRLSGPRWAEAKMTTAGKLIVKRIKQQQVLRIKRQQHKQHHVSNLNVEMSMPVPSAIVFEAWVSLWNF